MAKNILSPRGVQSIKKPIKSMLSKTDKMIAPEKIIQEVCRILSLDVDKLKSKCKQIKYIHGRYIIAYILYSERGYTYQQIAIVNGQKKEYHSRWFKANRRAKCLLNKEIKHMSTIFIQKYNLVKTEIYENSIK